MRLVTVIAVLLMVAACGQKGPLRLPDDAPTSQEASQESRAE